MRIDLRLRHQLKNCAVGQRHDFIDFVGSTETVKEMNKGHAAFERRYVRNQRKVLRFLHVTGAKHRATRLTDGHHIRVIAKNRQGMGRHGTCGDV
ncbi:hypothetical protein D3C80_955750 [compost metagenome]